MPSSKIIVADFTRYAISYLRKKTIFANFSAAPCYEKAFNCQEYPIELIDNLYRKLVFVGWVEVTLAELIRRINPT